MGKGRRFEEPKLNIKKVIAVIIAVIVLIMIIFILNGILSNDKEKGKISSIDYFVSFKDNKWGVIDSKGNSIIEPSYQEMITIPNSKNDVFLCVYDVNYETGEYKTKVLNSKNEEIFKQYIQIEAIQNKNLKNQVIYEKNILKVKNNEKYGIINLEGKELTDIKYDKINAVDGTTGILKVEKEGKSGIISAEGKDILKLEYKDIESLDKNATVGFIVKSQEDKYGIVNYSGQTILESKYEGIKKVYGNDLYVVIQSGKQILINKEGTELIKTGFDEITKILKDSQNGIIYKLNNKYGIMKTNGEIVIEATYEDLKEAKSGILIAKKDGKYGVIDIQKNIKIESKFQEINYDEKADIYLAEDQDYNNQIFDNSFNMRQKGYLINIDDEKEFFELRQNDEYKYYNFKFEEKKPSEIYPNKTLYVSKKDNKYGFVDKDGKVIVDYIYDDATEQNTHGYSAIKKDGKWGSIDNKGNISQEPVYNLDAYLKIDFIGRWHYGKDLNMNYYNQL